MRVGSKGHDKGFGFVGFCDAECGLSDRSLASCVMVDIMHHTTINPKLGRHTDPHHHSYAQHRSKLNT